MFHGLLNKKIQIHKLAVIYLLILSFAFIISGTPAWAQSKEYFDTKVSAEERAIFAFFRAANVVPDFEYWITSSAEYEALGSDKQKQDYLVKEMMRLGHGYGQYDADTDVLEIKAPIVVKYHAPKKEGEKPVLKFRFFDLDDSNIPTFDFPFGFDTVSLVIDNINAFSSITLSPEQDQAIRAKIPYDDDEFDANLIVHTRVFKADYDNPVKNAEDGKRWLMAGKIAYVECEVDSFYAQQKNTLWDSVAPWYEKQFRLKNMPEEEKYPHPYDLYK